MVLHPYYTRFFIWMVLPIFLSSSIGFTRAQESRSQGADSEVQVITIDMESYVFSPSEITIEKETTVKLILRNQSFLVPHNFLLDDPHGIRVLDADISSGESQALMLTLRETGMYSFYCDKQLLFFPNHRKEGMEGRLLVR